MVSYKQESTITLLYLSYRLFNHVKLIIKTISSKELLDLMQQ